MCRASLHQTNDPQYLKKKKKKACLGQESGSASHKLLCCLLPVQIGAEHGGQFHRHDSIIFCFY